MPDHSALLRALLEALLAEAKLVDTFEGRSQEETYCFHKVFDTVLADYRITSETEVIADAHLAGTDDAVVRDIFALFLTERPGRSIPDTKAPFAPPKVDVNCVLRQATELGYLTRVGDLYQWTDAARDILIDAGRWEDDGSSKQDAMDAKLADLYAERRAVMDHALCHPPDWAKAHIRTAMETGGPFHAVKSLNQVFDGRAWREKPDLSQPLGIPMGGLDTGKRLLEALLERDIP